MLPTPATRSWFSRNALTGCLRPRACARSASAVKSELSGSTPSREAKYSDSASLPSSTSPVPKRRTSTNRSRSAGRSRLRPSSNRTRRCGRPGSSSFERHEQQVAGHAQMHGEVDVVVGRHHEVLAAPPEPLHAPAAEGVGDRLGRGGLAPARIQHVHAHEPPALERGCQLAADRLYLGKLGHASGSSSRRPGAGPRIRPARPPSRPGARREAGASRPAA